MLARRFLWVVAGLIVLALAAALLYRLFGTELIRFTMVPSAAFEGGPAPAPNAYADQRLWIARPDMAASPALWMPAGMKREGAPRASVFFVHPTSYLGTSHWNAPLDDKESQWRAKLFVQSQASAFNGVAEIWAPKYRQATFGAFLTTKKEAQKALDFAYRDVAAAFDQFLREAPKDRPIILAGHSQGSLHLMRLLAERIAGRPEAKRIAAAYVIGWPVSIPADLPSLGLPACERRGQSGCVVSWQSFAEPADPEMITGVYDKSTGRTGIARAGSPMLCTNPLTGTLGGEAGAAANPGTLVPNAELTEGRLQAPGVPARCDVRGLLLIGEDAPELGPYVLPGNNYHVYDYALFWSALRTDSAARVAAWKG
jgi:pimeloyl-ACP methyl ester carboxylesterase